MRIEIPYTIPEKEGISGFEELVFNFSNMNAWMNVSLDVGNKTEYADIYTNYNLLTTEEKLGVIKYMKMNVVEIYNKVMGTSFTWENVPDELFEKQVVE